MGNYNQKRVRVNYHYFVVMIYGEEGKVSNPRGGVEAGEPY